jgi:hypothetical protein
MRFVWHAADHDEDAQTSTDALAGHAAAGCVHACRKRLSRPESDGATAVRSVNAFHIADIHPAASMARAYAKCAQPIQAHAFGIEFMNQGQNKYFSDRSSPGNDCCDRWTLVVSSDPALLATLHWVADDHFVGPKLESALSELLHEVELI